MPILRLAVVLVSSTSCWKILYSIIGRLPPHWGLPRSQPYFCWLSIQSRPMIESYTSCNYAICPDRLSVVYRPFGAYPGASPTFAGSVYSHDRQSIPFTKKKCPRRRCIIIKKKMLPSFDVWLIPPHWGSPRSQPYFCWLRIQCRQTSNAYP